MYWQVRGWLAGIPGVLVDLNGPPEAVWALSRGLAGRRLLIAEDAGHLDSDRWVQIP